MVRAYRSFRATLVGRQQPGRVWSKGLSAELDFWERMVPGDVATDDESTFRQGLLERANPEEPIRDPLLKMLIERIPEEAVSIIDVGAGPLTAFGKKCPGKTLNITATDPLADDYVRMMRAAGIQPPVRPVACRGEDLLDLFEPGTFDIAYSQNALDHCVDPVHVIRNMVDLVKEGRFVVLRHVRREGERMRYQGLHQWNFDVEEREFVIWRTRGEKVHVARSLGHTATVECFEEGEWVICTITKNALAQGSPGAPSTARAV